MNANDIRWQLRELAPANGHELRRLVLGIAFVLVGLLLSGVAIAIWLAAQEAATRAALNGGG